MKQSEINGVKYQDIFWNKEQQLKITKVFQKILEIRTTLRAPAAGLPGLNNLGTN